MGIVDKRRSRRKDLLDHRYPSSPSILLKNDTSSSSKTIDAPPQQPRRASAGDQSSPFKTFETMRSCVMHQSKEGEIIGSEVICIERIGNNKLPQHLPPFRSNRTVSFSSEFECTYIAQRSEEEKLASFYCKEEYDRIDAENVETIMEMATEKKYPVSETRYYRGLYVPRARYEQGQRIKFVVSKVLKEQERNKTLSKKWVKEFSKEFSRQTTAAALYLGKVDAKAAKDACQS
ncbi:MAG: hypothetical protein SGBAC_007592 [Bacillariaceae sp.]